MVACDTLQELYCLVFSVSNQGIEYLFLHSTRAK